jgi:hypothetical protein
VLMRQLLFKGLVLCTFTAMLSRVWLPQTVILRALVASRLETPELPVRSAVLKQDTGGLVIRWVTTSEYPLLYVFVFCCWAAGLLVCGG